MTKKTKKQIENRISEAYRKHCCGIAIPMLMIGQVFREGHRLIAAGATEAELGAGLKTFAEKIAVE